MSSLDRPLPPTGGMVFAVLQLLLTPRVRWFVFLLLTFVIVAPTAAAGFLTYEAVIVTRRQEVLLLEMVTKHNLEAGEQHQRMEDLLTTFLAAQGRIEEKRNALMFELCMNIANDGPARARCRDAIQRTP